MPDPTPGLHCTDTVFYEEVLFRTVFPPDLHLPRGRTRGRAPPERRARLPPGASGDPGAEQGRGRRTLGRNGDSAPSAGLHGSGTGPHRTRRGTQPPDQSEMHRAGRGDAPRIRPVPGRAGTAPGERRPRRTNSRRADSRRANGRRANGRLTAVRTQSVNPRTVSARRQGSRTVSAPAGGTRSGSGRPGRRHRPSPPGGRRRSTSAGSPGPHGRAPRRGRGVLRRGRGGRRPPR